MRRVAILVLSSAAAFSVSCTPPEQRVLDTFFNAAASGDEDAIARVSLVPFTGDVTSWEIVEIGPESSTPFPLGALQDELVSLREDLDAMVAKNDAFLRDNEEIYLEYVAQKEEDPEATFTGDLKTFDEEWTARMEEQEALDREIVETEEAIDALKKAAGLSTNTPGVTASYEGEVKEKEARLMVGDKDYTVTLKQYSLVNTEHNIEPMARWIITDISD